MNDARKSDKPIVPGKRLNKDVRGTHVSRRAWREGATGQGKSAHTGRIWTQRQNGTATTEGADTQRLLCVNTRGRSPVR
jgi:hypothetical protein